MFTLLRNSFVLTFFSCLSLFSCNPKDKAEIERTASAFDIEQGKASILQGNQNFMKAFKAGDSAGVANNYTNDAKIMADHMAAIEGKINIRSYIAKVMSQGIKDLELHTINIWGDSSLLAEEGTYVLADSTGNEADHGNYIVLWKPESGNWKMFRDIWTSDLLSPSPVPETK